MRKSREIRDGLEVWDRLFTIFRTLLREAERNLSTLGISWSEYKLLSIIEGEAKPMAALAADMMLSPAAVTSIVDRLESQELVRRSRCAEDRRLVKVQLTERGMDVLTKAEEIHNRYVESILPSLISQLGEVVKEAKDILIEKTN
jgi:Transcriptional regulators